MNADQYNIFIQIPNFVFCKDLNSTYISCNINLAKAAGLSSHTEIVGKTDYDLPWADYADLYLQGDQEVLNGSQLHVIEPWRPIIEATSIVMNKSLLFDKQGQKIGIIGNFMQHVEQPNYGKHEPGKQNLFLPPKQADCLFYVAQGLSAKHIANEMQLSPRTIESYIDILKTKLDCYNKSDLIKKAWSIGFIKRRLNQYL